MDPRRRLSQRIHDIRGSATMALASRAFELARQGRPVISLTAGEPHRDTPARIVEVACEALSTGHTRYTSVGGDPILTTAVVRCLAREGVVLEGPECVLPAPGAKQALFYALMGLVDPGDGVVVPEPAWVSYREMVGLARGRYIGVAMDPDQGFRLDVTRLRRAAAKAGGARVLLLNSPSNPTGRVLCAEELEAVARLAREQDWTVVADEIFSRLVYAAHGFNRVAALSRLEDRVVTVDGCSKAFSMTGWRLGWAVGPAALIRGLRKLQMHIATCPAAFVQRAAAAALDECGEEAEDLRRSLDARRRLVEQVFGDLPGIRVPPVEGSFFAFLDVRGVGNGDDVAVCERFLEEAEVAMIPGSAFGEAGRGFLRMNFAACEEDLREAARRLERVLGP